MKNIINLDEMPKLKEVVSLIKEHFSSSLQTVINQDVNLQVEEFYTGYFDDIIGDIENPIFIRGEDSENNLFCGFIFNLKDITALVDYMMMGEGESKDELDDETRDAAKELTNQIISSLNVPLSGYVGKKFNFSVVDVTYEKPDFEDEISGITFDLKADKIDSKYIFFVDAKFNNMVSLKDEADDISPDFGDFTGTLGEEGEIEIGGNIDLLLDVEIPVSVKIGSTKMYLKDILELGPGKIIELEEYADEPVELLVNNKVIARGEVVVVDGYFGLRIQEIVSRAERIKKLKD
ncbi:flagellar motor switch protein FliN [Deferribacter autotrophicus]|uniref:Flagellar motor switch protein FliN n=1 Tax=Deferribacter autotrophicus TaxID=500465 RepID=A0A5A8F149_9BACT|nr:flagellar motor switch protein FliN [Deferribacter autotrophicus]KAA0257111.1 flagellar motor switch protein FliN [Deferribacter autotrophicus]